MGPVSLTWLVCTAQTGILNVYVLVVVLLLLLSPVLVQLVDLHCCVTLFKQVKGLKQQKKNLFKNKNQQPEYLRFTILVKEGKQVETN